VLPLGPTRPVVIDSNAIICGAEHVAKLVRQLPRTRRSLVSDRLLALLPVLGHRLGNGIVETSVEGMKLGRGDRRLRLVRQLGKGLTDTPVVVDLGYFETPLEEISAVFGRALDRVGGSIRARQGADELVQEQGDAVRELLLRRAWRGSRRGLCARPSDDGGSVRQEEFVEHPNNVATIPLARTQSRNLARPRPARGRQSGRNYKFPGEMHGATSDSTRRRAASLRVRKGGMSV
jgi:hypothetical protein